MVPVRELNIAVDERMEMDDLIVKSRSRKVDWWRGNLWTSQILVAKPKPGILGVSPYAIMNYDEEAELPSPNFSMQFNETIQYQDNGRDKPNYCHHTVPLRRKASAVSLVSPELAFWDYEWLSPGNPRVFCDHRYRWLPHYGYGFIDGGYELVGSRPNVSAELARRLVELEAGAIKPVFNLPRAVLELKDVPQTVKGLSDMLRAVKGLTQGLSPHDASAVLRGIHNTGQGSMGAQFASWLSSLRKEGRELVSAVNGTVHDAARAYLTYQFGIKPTEKDISQFLGVTRGQLMNGLWFKARRVNYKRGQRLRVPFSLGPRTTDFPSCGPLYSDSETVLLSNWHSANGALQYLNSSVDFNIRPRRADVASGLVFGEVVNDKSVSLPFGELLHYSGGPLSTAWELTRMSFVVDWFLDVGRYLQNLEKAAFPMEYRPELKFGSWKSVCERSSTFLPVWNDLSVITTTLAPTAEKPSWRVRDVVQATAPQWVEAFQGDVIYERAQLSRLMSITGVPTLRVPGGYTLGPSTALIINSI